MDDKKSKGKKKVLPPAESFTNPDAVGWLYKHIHEGWLRKRWRKRYCVLSNGVVYLYEQKSSDGTEKTCGTVNLKFFGQCVGASEKESKKLSNMFVLEPLKKEEESNKNSTEANKKQKQVVREMFYTETAEELKTWISKLRESLSLANIGGNSKLKHITKTRARPPRGSGGNRRPPTKQHIKERAIMSEVSLDAKPVDQLENGTPSKKRGQIPLKALRPPPVGKTSLKTTNSNEPPLEDGNNETHRSTSTSSLPTPTTPKPPPAALKPPSTKRIAAERSDSSGSEDSKQSLSLPSPIEKPNLEEDSIEEASVQDDGSLKQEAPVEEESIIIEKGPSKEEGSLDGCPPLSKQTPSVEKENLDSAEEHSSPSTPPSSPLSDHADEEDAKSEISEEPQTSPTKERELKDNEFKLELLNLDKTPGERILKAKSMETLDQVDDSLPPPPSPPPLEEMNGDACDNNNKTHHKVKEKVKSQRPASLVLDIQ